MLVTLTVLWFFVTVVHLDPAWLALLGTLFGGVGLKAVERYLGRKQLHIDDATNIRNELRLEIESLREENKALEAEVDRWRASYYDLRDRVVHLETELTILKEHKPK